MVALWAEDGCPCSRTPLRVSGLIEGEFTPYVAASAAELAKNDVIILALPANGHRFVIDALAPHIEPRHCVIISSHLSFAGLYLSKVLAVRGIRIPIAAWSTTVLTGKCVSSTQVNIGTIRSKVDVAALPVQLRDQAVLACEELFGPRFVVKDDMLTVALSNLNPQNHLGIAICNLTRIEKGETWGQNSNVTPSVGRLPEALDRERIAIASALGKTVRTIFEHYSLSFGMSGDSVADISLARAAAGSDVAGPKTVETRYVLEDVPFGLLTTIFLSQMCNVSAPLHKSGIEILSACYGRDLTEDNDLLGELGVNTAQELAIRVTDGYL